MPILRISAPEYGALVQKGQETTPEGFNELVRLMLNASTEPPKLVGPGVFADITPPNIPMANRYVLTTPQSDQDLALSAQVHILAPEDSPEADLHDLIDANTGLKLQPHKVIDIPEMTIAFPLAVESTGNPENLMVYELVTHIGWGAMRDLNVPILM